MAEEDEMAVRLASVTLDEVRAGARWRLRNPVEMLKGGAPDQLEVEAASGFRADDYVVYSGVWVTDSGTVAALLMVKRVGEYDYGGEYYLFKNDRWTKLGVEPESDAEFGNEYIADPLANDPSFGTDDDTTRNLSRVKFQEWVSLL